MQKLMTVQQAANVLALSRSTIYNVMERGELAYVKIGRARRIPESEVDRFVTASMFGGRKPVHDKR